MIEPASKPKKKKPRPWDLDASRTGSVVLVIGVIISFGIHSGIPVAGVLWPVRSISQMPVTMEFESLPLPPAEELVDSPDEVDSPDDDPDVEDEPDPEPSPKPPTPKADPKPTKPDEPASPDEPIVDDADDDAVEAPAGDPPPIATVPESDLQQRIAERDAQRDAWLKERARQKAARDARRAARNKAREGSRKGGAPEGGSERGNPPPVYLCTPTELGDALQPKTERPITAWMPIVPTVFAWFETRPNLGDYLGRTNQVYVPKKRLGMMDFAAPAEVLQLELEQPMGTRIAVGRLDGRCMIGLRYRAKLFPIQLMRLPARIIDRNNKTVTALINLTIFKDASIEIVPYDKAQPALPFRDGRFKNGKQIARNIDDHFQAVRLANAFAELFGMKKAPAPKKEKKKKPGK